MWVVWFFNLGNTPQATMAPSAVIIQNVKDVIFCRKKRIKLAIMRIDSIRPTIFRVRVFMLIYLRVLFLLFF